MRVAIIDVKEDELVAVANEFGENALGFMQRERDDQLHMEADTGSARGRGLCGFA